MKSCPRRGSMQMLKYQRQNKIEVVDKMQLGSTLDWNGEL